MKRAALLLSTLLSCGSHADPWTFSAKLAVTASHGEQIFHHLDAAGRHNIAVSASHVGVAWEDNRSGIPAVYFATKAFDAEAFTDTIPLSAEPAAYEPSVLTLADGSWLVAWEQADAIYLRRIDTSPHAPIRLTDGAQISLSRAGDTVHAAWVAPTKPQRVMYAALNSSADGFATTPRPIDAEAAQDAQSRPVIAALPDGTACVAWEDRRHGHTRLYTSRLNGHDSTPPRQLNEIAAAHDSQYGAGCGVMQPTLTVLDDKRLVALWLDKRTLLTAYDVYAAFSDDGCATFGDNQLAQDSFGDNQPQWHASVAAHANGSLIAAWDDARDGTPDLWFSHYADNSWSEDWTPATGEGWQHSPAISFDTAGRLHLVWIEQSQDAAPTNVWYAVGQQ